MTVNHHESALRGGNEPRPPSYSELVDEFYRRNGEPQSELKVELRARCKDPLVLARFNEFLAIYEAAEAGQAGEESEALGENDRGQARTRCDSAPITIVASPSQWERLRYFGDYELLEEVARGGMGVVYRAKQTSLGRIVAVKMILAGHLASPDDVTRFRREAEAAARLRHPNIVGIFEVGEESGQHFFSMEYVEGTTLTELTRESSCNPQWAAEVTLQIVQAIECVHKAGLLHRDLKPSNVLLEAATNTPRITDFGLVKDIRRETLLTGDEQIVGTPSFMSPEQAAGKNELVGPASDIYSIGAILYQLLTARRPYIAATVWETTKQVLDGRLVAPTILNPSVPRDLETICLKCMRREIHRRYSTAGELADDLQRFLDKRPIKARPVPTWEKVLMWWRREPLMASLTTATAMSLILLVAVLVCFVMAQRDKARELGQAIDVSEQRRQALSQRLAESLRDEGVSLCLKGEVDQGYAVLLQSLQSLPPGIKPLEWSIRVNVDAWRRQLLRADHVALVEAQTKEMAQLWDGSVVVSRESRWIARLDKKRPADLILRLIAEREGVERRLTHNGPIQHAEFSADGSLLAVAYGMLSARDAPSGGIQIWETESGRRITQIVPSPDGSAPQFRSVLFRAGDSRIFVVSSRSLTVWDKHGAMIAGPLHGQFDQKLPEVSADGRFVFFQPPMPAVVNVDAENSRSATPEFRLFDVDSQKIHDWRFEPARFAVFHPAGQSLVTAFEQPLSENQDAACFQVWNARTGEKEGPPLVHDRDRDSSRAVQVLQSVQGRRIVTVSSESVRVWDESGRPQSMSLPAAPGVSPASLSENGRILVYATRARQTRLWDIDSEEFIGQPLPSGTATLSDTGTHLQRGSESWRIPDRGLLSRPLVHSPSYVGGIQVALSHGGWLALSTGLFDAQTRIWDLRKGMMVGDARQHEIMVQGVAFDPAGKWYVVGGQVNPGRPLGRALEFFDAQSGQPIARQLPNNFMGIGGLALSDDGDWLAISGRTERNNDLEIGIYDVKRDRWVSQVPWPREKGIPNTRVMLKWAPGARTLLVYEEYPRRVTLWDRRTETTIGGPSLGNAPIRDFAFSPEGRTLAVVENGVSFWDTATCQRRYLELDCREKPVACAYGKDGRWFATLHEDRTARVWHAATGDLVGKPLLHEEMPRQVAFLWGGRLLAVGTVAGIYLWDPLTGVAVGPPLRPSSLMIPSPDGSVVGGIAGSEFRVWKAPNAAVGSATSLATEMQVMLSPP